MGRTKQFPCPSAVLLSVVPTKPCYTIVPVFVKGHYLLLDMSRLSMLVLVVLGGIFSLPDEATGSHGPSRSEQLKGFLWAVEQISQERQYLHPKPDKWSVARIIYHMMRYDQLIGLPTLHQGVGGPSP